MDFNCRFTERTLTIKPHGSGLKLTINVPGLNEQGEDMLAPVSVFIDAKDVRTLTDILVGLGFGPRRATAPVTDEAVDAAHRLAQAAIALEAALTR